MKPYTPSTNLGRTKAIDDIHHRTSDYGFINRVTTAKSQGHAARQEGRKAGWYGVGTFGEVGPTDTLRQAIVRSGI